MPDDIETQRLIGQYGAEIRALRHEIKEAKAGQIEVLKALTELKEDMDEWKGASRTVIGIATAVAAVLGATISHFLVLGATKIFGG